MSALKKTDSNALHIVKTSTTKETLWSSFLQQLESKRISLPTSSSPPLSPRQKQQSTPLLKKRTTRILLLSFLTITAFFLLHSIKSPEPPHQHSSAKAFTDASRHPPLHSRKPQQKTWTPPPLFNRTEFTTIVEERRWWKSRLDHRQTVFIVSANLGTFPNLRNMVCSLILNAPDLIDRLVIWALDEDVALKLLEFREQVVKARFLMKRGNRGRVEKAWKTPMGIYFDRKITTTPKYTTGAADLVTYFGITELRNYFYVRILDEIGINFVFSDADVFFSSDPFEDLNLPYGVQDHWNRTKARHGPKDPTSSFYRDFPDLIYSTDARKPYHLLPDPYEGQTRIPHICGGFFFARSIPRVIRLFRTIRDFRMNDQWGVDYLINEVPAILVDPLPAGLTYRKHAINVDSLTTGEDAWRKQWGWGNPLRIRLLSQAAYSNALTGWQRVGTRGPAFGELVEELKKRGEKPVMFHPNYWIQATKPLNTDLWVFTDNKTWILDQVGMWKVHEERCMA